MSLKAKLEAVIYAAEDPVTLAQLAELLAHELPVEEAHPETQTDPPEAVHDAAIEAPAVEEPQPEITETPVKSEEPAQPVLPAVADEKKAAKARERQQRAAL